MIFTTHNSHYKFGVDGINDFRFKDHKDQNYTVEFGRASKILSFKEAAIATAKQIFIDANGSPIYISYSGGIDSEFVVRSFLEAGVPFEIITAKFKNDINAYDFHFVKKFCTSYNLKLNILDVDIENFLETKMMDYAVPTKCCSPQFPLHMYLWDSFDGFIISGYELVFKRTPPSPEFYFYTPEKEDSAHRYYIWRNRSGCPGFYFYTPELALAYMLEQELLSLFLFGKIFQQSNSKNQKINVYKKYYNIEDRISKTGFENIMELDKKYRVILEEMFGTGYATIPLNKLLKQLYPEELIDNKTIICGNDI